MKSISMYSSPFNYRDPCFAGSCSRHFFILNGLFLSLSCWIKNLKGSGEFCYLVQPLFFCCNLIHAAVIYFSIRTNNTSLPCVFTAG